MTPLRMMVACCLVMAITFAGCAQNQDANVSQVPEQKTTTPVRTEQAQITPGHTIEIWACNVPDQKAVIPRLLGTGPSPTGGTISNSENQKLAETGAGFVVNQYITLNIGNQTPTGTASATGTGTATQTPSQTSTLSPVQTIEPTLSAPLTFGMPGSAVSAQSTAVGRGGTATGQTANPTQTPTWAQQILSGACGQDGVNWLQQAAQSYFETVFGGKKAAPTTAPAAN